LPRIRNQLSKNPADQQPASYEVEVVARDGRRVPVELSSNLVFADGVPVGYQGVARDITERKHAEELLQTFPRRLIEAQETERRRIARELHDEIGQVLTAVTMSLQAVQALELPQISRSHIDESILIVDYALHHVQNLALELRPSLLDDLGLEAAIRWFVDRYAHRTGIKAEVATDAQIAEGRLSRELETACFRIVQEALTNVARHAEAKTVSIYVRVAGFVFPLKTMASVLTQLPGMAQLPSVWDCAGWKNARLPSAVSSKSNPLPPGEQRSWRIFPTRTKGIKDHRTLPLPRFSQG
jgi:signal transduction histidine kinase